MCYWENTTFFCTLEQKYIVFTKMIVISLSINRFPKIRILRRAEITYYPFPSRKRPFAVGNQWGTGGELIFPALVLCSTQLCHRAHV